MKTYAEALMTVAHAVYKERIYTSNDYITVSRWYDGRGLKLTEEFHCLDPVRKDITIHKTS